MPERIALKRLTASDLTFFEVLFRTLKVGNQKSINLNADVFIGELYQALPSLVPTLGDKIPISLTILGPAGAPAYELTRAVTKGAAYKNWRLNGEFVRNPDGEPARFDNMVAGDLAVFDFEGEPSPQKASLLLVSAKAPADSAIHAALDPLIPGERKTMVRITREELAGVAAGVAATHPIWALAADPDYDAALEDAALGGVEGAEKLATKAAAKPVSAATLAAAKAAAEKNGQDGEALAWVLLKKWKADGTLTSIEWVSRTNAVSPFDFRMEYEGEKIRVDAKSTSGKFERPIHMSAAELTAAATGERYDLWRIYEINEDGARMKMAVDIAETAKKVLAGITLPQGISVDSVSIDPKIFEWSAEEEIERPDEDDGND
jgi:hypothetical protein